MYIQTNDRRLPPDEERSLILRWQRLRDETAATILCGVHEQDIRQLAHSIWQQAKKLETTAIVGRMINEEELQGAGWEAFSRALSRYDTNIDARLWTFAYPRVKGAMVEEIEREAGLSTNAQMIYTAVRDTIRSLEADLASMPNASSAPYLLVPTVEEILPHVAQQPRIQDFIQKGKLDEKRLKLAVKEVLETRTRIIEMYDEEPAESGDTSDSKWAAPASIQRQGRYPTQSRALNRAILHDHYHLSKRILGEQTGFKWWVLFILRESGYQWKEISAWCSKEAVQAGYSWPQLYGIYSLASISREMSSDWESVSQVFQSPPPGLDIEGIRGWYNDQQHVICCPPSNILQTYILTRRPNYVADHLRVCEDCRRHVSPRSNTDYKERLPLQ